MPREADRALGQAHGERRVGGDGTRDGVDLDVERRCVGEGAIDDADPLCLACVIRACREEQLGDDGIAEDFHHASDARVAVAEPEAGGRHAKARLVVGVAQIAGDGQRQAAAHADAVDAGDYRNGASHEGRLRLLEGPVVGLASRLRRPRAVELADVGARHEGARPFAAQDQHAHALVVSDRADEVFRAPATSPATLRSSWPGWR